jgi:hypothetical protein
VLRAPGFLHEHVLCGYQAQYVCMSSVVVHQDIEQVLFFRFLVTFIEYLIISSTFSVPYVAPDLAQGAMHCGSSEAAFEHVC